MPLWKKLLLAVTAYLVVMVVCGNIVNCASVIRRTVPMWLVIDEIGVDKNAGEEEEQSIYGTVIEKGGGTVTLDMNKDQYELLLKKAQEICDEQLTALPRSPGYENVVGITHNKHYSYFVIATLNESVTMEERALAVILQSYGQMYANVLGIGTQNVRVEFMRNKTGTIIEEVKN